MITVRFSCACQRVKGSARVLNSTLPLPFSLCHCNVCRHQSGLLCASYVSIGDSATDFKVEGPLIDYKSSDFVTRSFCSHCGANVWFEDKREKQPYVCTGTLTKSEGIIKLKNHIFVIDTTDGGLSTWIPDADIIAWEEFPRKSKQITVSIEPAQKTPASGTSEVQAYCYCRGVQFKITRPNQHSKLPSSPWSDLLKPYHSHSTENVGDVKWWLRDDDTKYLAGLCACKSCRLASGFDIQAWAFVPKANILQVDESLLDYGMGTLKQYDTAGGVHRNFCGRCGATVFFHCDERPDVVDVSVGLFDADEGVRAESWFEWCTSRISFEEAAHNENLISRLSAGLRHRGSDKR